ncbi:MAG: PucR family transcriptional regulator, partial [Acetanaerobacterium sp.]
DKLYPGLTLSIAIGEQHLSLAEMRESLNEAELALRAGKCRVKRERFHYYKDIGLFSILFAVQDKKVLERFYTDTLGTVIEYDRLNNATLLYTLETFLESNGNLAEISQKLFIHKNTLKYRIIKIEEITGLNVKSVSDCIRLELALMIGRLLEQERR